MELEFLAGAVVGLVFGALFGAFGGPLLGAARARYAGRRQDREDERLLGAFRELSDRDPDLPVAVHEVREVANFPDLDEGLDRLQRKGHIAKHPDGWGRFILTDDGRRASSEQKAR